PLTPSPYTPLSRSPSSTPPTRTASCCTARAAGPRRSSSTGTGAGRSRGTSGGTCSGTGAVRHGQGEAHPGELLGQAPQAARHLGVPGAVGALDRSGLAAGAEASGGADEGVAGKIRGGGHQRGQRPAHVALPQQGDER